MIMQLKDWIFEKRYGYMYVEGKYYVPKGNIGADKFTFVEIKDVDERLKLAQEVTEQLVNQLDGRKVLMEAIMKLDKKDLKVLYRNVFKKKYKAKTRGHYCVDMKIGNFVLPIINDRS